MGPTVDKFDEFELYSRQNALRIRHHILIGEVHDVITHLLERTVAVPIRIYVVRVTINLDDQAFGRTEEIDDEGADDGLTTEFETELRIGEVTPQSLLGFCRLITHGAGTFTERYLSIHPRSPPQPLP